MLFTLICHEKRIICILKTKHQSEVWSQCDDFNFVFFQVVENAVFPSYPDPPMWRHVTITLLIVFLTAAVSMATDCLGIVLELNVSNHIQYRPIGSGGAGGG